MAKEDSEKSAVDCFELQMDFVPLSLNSLECGRSSPTSLRAVTREPTTVDLSTDAISDESTTSLCQPSPVDFLGALHEEILDFAARMTPSINEIKQRAEVVERVRSAAKTVNPGCSIHLFGSTLTGLALPSSDIDLVCFNWGAMGNITKRTSLMRKFAEALCKAGLSEEEDIEIIATARVPIVKFKDPETGFLCDCCFDRQGGLDGAKLVKRMRKKYGAFLPLSIFLKFFNQTRCINKVFTGGIGSFSLCCMLVSMFQSHETRSNRKVSRALFKDCSTGSWLMEFFRLYGFDFNYSKVAISIAIEEGLQFKTGRLLKPNMPYLLSIINPYERDTDAARNSYLIMWARKAYQTSYKNLLAAADSYPELPKFCMEQEFNEHFPILGQLLPADCLEPVLARPVPSANKPPFNFLSKKPGVIKNGLKRKWNLKLSGSRTVVKRRRIVYRSEVDKLTLASTMKGNAGSETFKSEKNKRKVFKKKKLLNHIRKVVRKR